MSIDPEFASAVKSALAVLATWSGELAGEGKYDEALQVLATGLRLAPQDAALRHNRTAVWGALAEAAMKAGQDAEALAILDRAAAEVPDAAGAFAGLKAWVYVRKGEEQARAGAWQKAADRIEPGLTHLDGRPREEFRRWAVSLYARWAQAELQGGHFAEAVDVLDRGLVREPKDPLLSASLAYAAQEWARDVSARKGPAEAGQLLQRLIKEHPAVPDLKRGATGYVLVRVSHRAMPLPALVMFPSRCVFSPLLRQPGVRPQ
jgi:tetratricopeptide (TPR) repeat protein